MNKQPEITDATRNTFIEAFCELYEVRQIEKITVKEIVQKAGYSRATFYNYFKDAYDLLEYIENEFISSLMDTIISNVENRQTLESFVHDFVGLVKSEQRYIHVFMNSSNSPSFVNKLKKEALPLLMSSFNIASNNLSAKYTLEFYISGLVPVIGLWLKNNQDISIEDLAILIKGILQDGILEQLR